MAKQQKKLPARRRRDQSRENSILLRSAESIGRVIGTLQRQLDDTRSRVETGGATTAAVPNSAHNREKTRKRKSAGTRKKAPDGKSPKNSAASRTGRARKAARRPRAPR